MRRIGIVVLAICALFTISAVAATDTKTAKSAKPAVQTDLSPTPLDSPLVRAAKISYEARMHPKSRVIIDSNTLVVRRWSEPAAPVSTAAAPPADRGRSWQSGNSTDYAAVAASDKAEREQKAAAERARQASLRQEQAYMAAQEQEPYAEVIDDHVTKRLEEIPAEMKQKPPM